MGGVGMGGLSGSSSGYGGLEFQTTAWPLRVMVFIDGSWLYYSLHGRRPNCPITQRYGEKWFYSNSVAYERLPYLISQHLHEQLLRSHGVSRFVEVARTVVFTSYRADTPPGSPRMKMFRQMAKANFEVHVSTTSGWQEKCIDISLAVEMMHFASTPGAYDIAVLLSGDKDFMPAMSRIRQKGKSVALCSMRNCCSRDMLDPGQHVRDFEPIWLDDHLDYLITPTPANPSRADAASSRAGLALLRLVTAFLVQNKGTVRSRELGRFLQGCAPPEDVVADAGAGLVKAAAGGDDAGEGTTSGAGFFAQTAPSHVDALTLLKSIFGSLTGFANAYPEQLHVEPVSTEDDDDPTPKLEFQMVLAMELSEAQRREDELMMEAKSVGAGGRRPGVVGASGRGEAAWAGAGGGAAGAGRQRSATVQVLRARLRQMGLSVTGRKAELAERLAAAMAAERGAQGGAQGGSDARRPLDATLSGVTGAADITADSDPPVGTASSDGVGPGATPPAVSQGAAPATAPRARGAATGLAPAADGGVSRESKRPSRPSAKPGEVEEGELVRAVCDCLSSSGGASSSRMIGRKLASLGLLTSLKTRHAGLFHFLQAHADVFGVELPHGRTAGRLEYQVRLTAGDRK